MEEIQLCKDFTKTFKSWDFENSFEANSWFASVKVTFINLSSEESLLFQNLCGVLIKGTQDGICLRLSIYVKISIKLSKSLRSVIQKCITSVLISHLQGIFWHKSFHSQGYWDHSARQKVKWWAVFFTKTTNFIGRLHYHTKLWFITTSNPCYLCSGNSIDFKN